MSESKNVVRTERTRGALLDTARALFATNGYAATSTPSIVDRAGISRGALYHHFRDKSELFAAVVEREFALVADAIEKAAGKEMSRGVGSIAVLAAGGDAYLDAMRDPGRRRLLLIDAPAVLGAERVAELNDRYTGMTLRSGIASAVECGDLPDLPVGVLADVLDATYDRAALVEGDDRAHRQMIRRLLEGLGCSR